LGAAERKRLAGLAARIVGFPSHSSVHCGGIVVSDRPLTCYTPLEMAPKGIQVTQFDMHAVEKVGLIKIDLLGNRALTVIEETCAEAAARGRPVPGIPPDDPATARALKSGKTLTCFQLESPAMRSLLAMMKATTRADTMLALALVRPGPSAGGMKQEYIRRRLEPPGRNRGPAGRAAPGADDLPVYEEDIMHVIAGATGVGLAEADIIRRCLKDGGDEALHGKFILLARTSGRSAAEAEAAWADVRRFARYTFSKAHATSFGALAYAAIYLKTHFPLEFCAAALRNHSGMYPLWVHVNEARRIGVAVALPSVQRSAADFRVEGQAIRTGLSAVKHLAQSTIEAIIRARAEVPFESLRDFLARVPADKEEVLSLMACGALDDLVPERCGAITEYLAMRGKARGAGNPVLGFAEPESGLPARAFSAIQKRRMEYAGLGFSPLVHPLEFFDGNGAPGAGALPGAARQAGRVCEPRGGRAASGAATVSGVLAALRHYKETRPGLWFLSLDHPGGIAECIVPDDLLAVRLEVGAAYACTGTLQRRFGVPSLRSRSVSRLDEKFI
jgi:DNA polymerase III alpha subunit